MAPERHKEGFPFLLLPSEVRLNVYKLVFAPPDTTSANTFREGVHGDLHNYPNTASSIKQNLALLSTCRKIHSEAYPSLCEHTILHFSHPIDFANDLLRTLPPTNLSSIRHIKYHIPTYYRGEGRWSKGLVKVFKIYRELANLHCLILETEQDWWNEGYRTRFQRTGDGNEISDQYGAQSLWDVYGPLDARKAAMQLSKGGALSGFEIDGRIYLFNPGGFMSFPGAGTTSRLVFNLILTKQRCQGEIQ